MICPYCDGKGKIDGRTATVGALVKAARKHSGMTQPDLAARLHCSKAMVAMVETDRYTPPVTKLRRWAKALNVPVDELVPG